MSSKEYLSFAEQTVYEYLLTREGEDVPIIDLYRAIYKHAPTRVSMQLAEDAKTDNVAFRRVQQYVGSRISCVRKKRRNIVIEPGKLKRTYTLKVK